eukprot:scaffold207741_cov19-Tisochrysis_lutea.AAC.1
MEQLCTPVPPEKSYTILRLDCAVCCQVPRSLLGQALEQTFRRQQCAAALAAAATAARAEEEGAAGARQQEEGGQERGGCLL